MIFLRNMHKEDHLAHLQACFMADGFFRMQRRMVPFSAGTNGE